MSELQPIRAIGRALIVLQAINRLRSGTLTQIADETELPYPTVNRIVQTLVHEGMIEREAYRKVYYPTELVRSLSFGFQDDDVLLAASKKPMEDFTARYLWPVCLTTRVGNRMMVKHSTHKMTTQTFVNYFAGHSVPLLETAAGHAHLAFCKDEERDAILAGFAIQPDDSISLRLDAIERGNLLEKIRAAGYATVPRQQDIEMPGKVSSIAIPLFSNSDLLATISLIYFDNAYPLDEALERNLEPLNLLAEDIAGRL